MVDMNSMLDASFTAENRFVMSSFVLCSVA